VVFLLLLLLWNCKSESTAASTCSKSRPVDWRHDVINSHKNAVEEERHLRTVNHRSRDASVNINAIETLSGVTLLQCAKLHILDVISVGAMSRGPRLQRLNDQRVALHIRSTIFRMIYNGLNPTLHQRRRNLQLLQRYIDVQRQPCTLFCGSARYNSQPFAHCNGGKTAILPVFNLVLRLDIAGASPTPLALRRSMRACVCYLNCQSQSLRQVYWVHLCDRFQPFLTALIWKRFRLQQVRRIYIFKPISMLCFTFCAIFFSKIHEFT